MTNDPLGSLLKDITPEPPHLVDYDALVADARRRQVRRRTALVSAVTVAAVAATAAFALSWSRVGQVAAPAAGPPAAPSSVVGAGVPGAGSCPALRPGTDDASADYLDLLVWQGQTYVSTPAASGVRLGQEITTVGCSIDELTRKNHNLVEPMPWPDRTATFLPVGTPVYAVDDVKARCAVAVEAKAEIRTYTAVDLDTPDQRPVC